MNSSEAFSPIPIEKLFSLIETDFTRNKEIFGIHEALFFNPDKSQNITIDMFGKTLQTPIGVAAGPHTQMAQNIISAWLCGARYIELKTIQTLDELEISKPCIDMQDEGYNCEWSQELRISESIEEYVKAWIIIHYLHHKLGFKTASPGVVFNMSVGYNYEGIINAKVQRFFHNMSDSSVLKQSMLETLSGYPLVYQIEIPDCISDNITLSTMHGCPPDEIEKIGHYLLKEKKLHTLIKLNPTLLGKEELRKILNETLQFKTHVPDIAFEHDLKYNDAIGIINRLQQAADNEKLFFGVKLTNTLESINHKNIFPPKEEMMYMSGRALHPISIQVVKKLQHEFKAKLNVSFSAGADCFNVSDLLACNLKPVTVCSDILKTGGYGRLQQYIEHLEANMKDLNCNSIEALTLNKANHPQFETAVLHNISQYADEVLKNPAFRKNPYAEPSIKTQLKLDLFDCIHAPCVDTCPTNQDIPDYLYHTAYGDFDKAFETILLKNPFPNVLGMACDHLCQAKCTRINYDSSILIRDVKRFISENAMNTKLPSQIHSNGFKVAIIGGGPSGLSCAFYLKLAGFDVEIYETKDLVGGMIADAIPSFRLSETAIHKDIERIISIGVKIHYNTPVGKELFVKLRNENQYIYLAIGAQTAKKLNIENEDAKGVIDPLKFLSAIRRGSDFQIGKNIVVVGGGNTAMDVARTALRMVGNDGKVTVLYRRTRSEMPADADEIKDLVKEGIEILELTAPEQIVMENGKVNGLLCSRMSLGEKDDSGRARPVKIKDSEFVLACDTIIPALGQDRVAIFANDVELVADGKTGETKIPNVYIGGDAKDGAATIVKAVGDGRRTAENIIAAALKQYGIVTHQTIKNLSYSELMVKKSKRKLGIDAEELSLKQGISFNLVNRTLTKEEAVAEASRCLYCDTLCSICVTVCPNRANKTYEIKPLEIQLKKAVKTQEGIKLIDDGKFKVTQQFQVFNIGNFCNACGNCTTFCPTSGAPFMDKPRFMLTQQSFEQQEKAYYLESSSKILKKEGNNISSLYFDGKHYIYRSAEADAVFDPANFDLIKADLRNTNEAAFKEAAEMFVLLSSVGLKTEGN